MWLRAAAEPTPWSLCSATREAVAMLRTTAGRVAPDGHD